MKLIALLCFLTLAISAQSRPQRQRGGGGNTKQNGNPNDKTAQMVLPSFTGILKLIDKKFILLESEDGNTQKVNITKKTKFFNGEKQVTLADFKEGVKISAEVQIAPDRSFDGVHVYLEKSQ